MKESASHRATNVVALLAMMLFTLVPLFGVLSAALQPQNSTPTGLALPWPPHWENFGAAWVAADLLPLIGSSLLIVLGVVPAALLLATLAGFGLSQPRVPAGRTIALVFVAGLSVPTEALISPLYYQIQSIGLINSRWAIILPLIALYMPFGVYWMYTHFSGMPEDLSEAARIDGASTVQVFLHVQLPLARASLSALMILLFLWTWNQFLLAIVLVDDPLKRTVAGAIASFQGQYNTNIVLLSAGSLLIVAPSLIVFIIFQRQFIGALLQGSGK